ncbi:ribokinase [Nocardioides sp. OK12]|uniref:carbohydrate kinase family protein n=1 Tax=Nocardioides sp. OK12 TaxID=2758661 RepID=UPI0021C3F06C|nr:carbohydrate kinase [Nocardioides sp. OK12]GHJ58969.1 ribokinase [Nocardioides sp. OK12]
MDRDVMVVGEALVDVVRTADGSVGEHPGGSAANVAVALARLGRTVRFATSYADDAHGRMLAEHLGGSGVALALDPHVVERTSTAAATIGADGAASYEFDLDWRLGDVPTDPAPAAVHVCSFSAVIEPGAGTVRALVDRLREHATVSYDVNVRAAVTGTGPDVVAGVESVVALADLVKVSDEDVELLWPDLTVERSAARLLTMGPSVVVLTRGAEGATWFDHEREVTVAPRRVEVADTIGAGDTFAAALVDGLAEEGLLGGRLPALAPEVVQRLLAHAAHAASITVSRPGADPPYRAELV